MKEYITKDRAKQFVCGHCNEVCSEEPCQPSDCDWMAFIDKEPAADVISKGLYEQIKWERDVALAQLEEYGVSLGEKADVAEVRHGKWIGIDSSFWKPTHSSDIPVFRKTYRCSECRRRTAIAENYCPNCGAYMMGENNGKCE